MEHPLSAEKFPLNSIIFMKILSKVQKFSLTEEENW